MELRYGKCDKCILEELLLDIPDYKFERWGYMPIWGEYTKKSKRKLCVVAGDIELESICLEHLFGKEI